MINSTEQILSEKVIATQMVRNFLAIYETSVHKNLQLVLQWDSYILSTLLHLICLNKCHRPCPFSTIHNVQKNPSKSEADCGIL